MKNPLNIPEVIPLLPNRVWRTYQGGKLLDELQGKKPEETHFPETWIASTTRAVNTGREEFKDEGLSKVNINGNEYFLKDLINDFPEIMVGKDHYEKYGPDIGFLLKFLDPSIRLHIQCHPTIEFAQKNLNSNSGKTEGYVILGSHEDVSDPHIYFGFQDVPDINDFKKAVIEQDTDFMLSKIRKISVKPGDVFLVPGGQPHAIGEGVFMMEIMEPTDFAVRLEFERGGYVLPVQSRFMGRDVDFALSMFNFDSLSEEDIKNKYFVQPEKLEIQEDSVLYSMFDHRYTGCFKVKRLEVKDSFVLKQDSFYVAVVTKGEGIISTGDENFKIKFGDQFFVTNTADKVEFNSENTMEVMISAR